MMDQKIKYNPDSAGNSALNLKQPKEFITYLTKLYWIWHDSLDAVICHTDLWYGFGFNKSWKSAHVL